MKSKLIKELLAVLMTVKEKQSDVTLDMNEDNKQFVYTDLLIPLMNLTNADNLTQLHEQLEFLMNGSVDSGEHAELASTLINYILDDEDSELKFSEELTSLLVNCMAVLNTFDEMKGKDDKTLDTMNEEIIALINVDDKEAEEGSEGADALVDTSKNEAAAPVVEEEEPDPAEEPEPEAEETEGPSMEIVDPAAEVDETPWGEVNKVELKNTVKAALDENEANKAIVDEVFALVKSYDKVSDWQWPHHVVVDNKVLLNVKGLTTAALFLLKPNSSKNLTTDERTSIASHLLRHYDELKMEKPDKLNKLVEGKESTIVINIKDDELQEFGEMFKVSAENIGTYVGLIEALLTDFVNSGIIDIESNDESGSDSVIAVKLNKQQTEEFIKYFDIISDDIVNILASEFDSLSYKQTDTSLENRFQESLTQVSTLQSQIEELHTTIETNKVNGEMVAQMVEENKLTQTKFQAIIDFIKSSDSVDETVIQFINNVIEAESDRDISYMAKIGKSFLKASVNSDATKFIKKSSIISKFKASEVAELLDLVSGNNESAVPASASKNVDRLASFLD